MQPRSTTPSRLWRLDWLWLAGLAALLSLHLWFPRIGTGTANDTYSTSAEGKKAFYLLAAQQVYYTERNFDSLLDLMEELVYSPYGRTSIVGLLGPARYPDDDEWDALLDWVSLGGSLVIAAHHAQPEFEIEPLGIRVVPLWKAENGYSGDAESPVNTSLLDSDDLHWESPAVIEADGAEPLVEHRGTVQAVLQQHGAGHVVVVAGDFVFSNQSLAWGDNSVLAFRLLESAANDEIEFVTLDEWLNSSGTPKVVALLLEPFLRPVTVQLFIGLLVFAWWRNRRFGPIERQSVSARHNIVDHTDMVGTLYYKSRDGRAPLRAYLRQLVRELRLKQHRGQEDRILEPIARRLNQDLTELRQFLSRAGKAARADHLDRTTAANLIRGLARIRRAAQPPS